MKGRRKKGRKEERKKKEKKEKEERKERRKKEEGKEKEAKRFGLFRNSIETQLFTVVFWAMRKRSGHGVEHGGWRTELNKASLRADSCHSFAFNLRRVWRFFFLLDCQPWRRQ